MADSNLLLGHDALLVEVIDAPFQPVDTLKSTEIVKGFLFRAYVNKLNWRQDTRNETKFADISHFNLYRRSAGEPEWGSPLIEVPFTDSSTTYEYIDAQAFLWQSDAESYEYAVSVVALVNNEEKESKKTLF